MNKYQKETNINNKEEEIVKTFKLELKKEEVFYDCNQIDDFVLLRFLYANNMNVPKSVGMFINFLNWRKYSKVEEIPHHHQIDLKTIRQFFPYGWHKTDKMGRPVLYQVLGKLDMKNFTKEIEQEISSLQIKELEDLVKYKFPACRQYSRTEVNQMLCIIDLNRSSRKVMNKKMYSFIKLKLLCIQNNYPEILSQMFIINSDFLFKVCWTLSKPFMTKKTKQKVSVLGKEYQKKLLQYIPPHDLPKIYGGDCECSPQGCLESNVGPWNKVNEEEYEDENLFSQEEEQGKLCKRFTRDIIYEVTNEVKYFSH